MGINIDSLRQVPEPAAAMPGVIYDEGSIRKNQDELEGFVVDAIIAAAESARESGLTEIRVAVIGKKAAYWKSAKMVLRKKYKARTNLHRAYFAVRGICVEAFFFSVFYNANSLRGFHNFDLCIYLGDWVRPIEHREIERLLKPDAKLVFVRVQEA